MLEISNYLMGLFVSLCHVTVNLSLLRLVATELISEAKPFGFHI
jgi:hypothetical protein